MTMNCPQIIHELIIDEKFVGNSWTFRGQFMDFRVRVRACSQIASVVKYVFYVFLSKKKNMSFMSFCLKRKICLSVTLSFSSVLLS